MINHYHNALNNTELSSPPHLHTIVQNFYPSSRPLLCYIMCERPLTIRRQNVAMPLPKGKGSLYSITERRVPELIPALGSQSAGDVSRKPHGRLPLLSVRPAVTPATLKRAATSFAAWWTEARWVWTICLRLLLDSVATAIWTRALLRLSPAR